MTTTTIESVETLSGCFTFSEQPDRAELAIYADYLETETDRHEEALALRLSLELTEITEEPSHDNPQRQSLEAQLRDLVRRGIQAPLPRAVTTLPGGVEIHWRYIPPGFFWQGSPASEKGRQANEALHPVLVTQGFWMSDFPVTQGQWRAVMGDNPSYFQGENLVVEGPTDDLPVENVSWDDCQGFIARLREMENDETIRMPTESQWEYACRAGGTTPYNTGWTITSDDANFDDSAREGGKYVGQTTPRGSYPANAWGLQDMHGNVWEWCDSVFEEHTDKPKIEGPAIDPFGRGPFSFFGLHVAAVSTGTSAVLPGAVSSSLTAGDSSASASPEGEGEQSLDPIEGACTGCTGAAAGSATTASFAVRRSAAGTCRGTGSRTWGFASSEGEGEQSPDPIEGACSGCSGAAAGTATAGIAVRRTAAGACRGAGTRTWGFASPEGEGEGEQSLDPTDTSCGAPGGTAVFQTGGAAPTASIACPIAASATGASASSEGEQSWDPTGCSAAGAGAAITPTDSGQSCVAWSDAATADASTASASSEGEQSWDPFGWTEAAAGATSALVADRHAAAGTGRSSGTSTSASGSSEGEQSPDPIEGAWTGCTGAAAGSTAASFAVRRTATGSGRCTGSGTWGFASLEGEGEQSPDPFGWTGAAAGTTTARIAVRRAAAGSSRSSGSRTWGFASSEGEGEQSPDPIEGACTGCTGAAAGAATASFAVRRAATGSSRSTGTRAWGFASPEGEGEQSPRPTESSAALPGPAGTPSTARSGSETGSDPGATTLSSASDSSVVDPDPDEEYQRRRVEIAARDGYRVFRSVSWDGPGPLPFAPSSYRYGVPPSFEDLDLGFRLIRDAVPVRSIHVHR